MWTGRPDASQAASARARRSARARVGSIGVVLVDPIALPVAIDGGGAEIADPRKRRQRAQIGAVQVEPGIAGLVGGDRGQDMGDAGEGLGGQRSAAVEREHRPALGNEGGHLVGPARRPADLPTFGSKAPRQHPGRVAEAETEQGAAHGSAVSHSSRTPASGSPAACAAWSWRIRSDRGKPGQRPDRHPTHDRGRVAQQRLDRGRQSRARRCCRSRPARCARSGRARSA